MKDAESLVEVLDRIAKADGKKERVTFDGVLDTLGGRSFGPILLVAGLIVLAPIIGDIPGVPTMMGILVILTAGQVLLRRKHLWFPGFVLRRTVARTKLEKVTRALQKPARFVDRVMRPRLTPLVVGAGMYLVALMSIVVGAALPPMELVPFSANAGGAVLVAFGMSLLLRDGLVALIGILAALGILTVVLVVLF